MVTTVASSDTATGKDEMSMIRTNPWTKEEEEVVVIQPSSTVLFNGYNDPSHYRFVCLFYSMMANPLAIWDKKCWGDGEIRRVQDADDALSLTLSATNHPGSTYMTCPRRPYYILGVRLNWIHFCLLDMRRNFSIHIQVKDEFGIRRRIIMSNYQYDDLAGSRGALVTFLRIGFPAYWRWTEFQYDLAELTLRAFGVHYAETCRVEIHACCRVRMIYFSAVQLPMEEALPLLKEILMNGATDEFSDPERGQGKSYLLVPFIPSIDLRVPSVPAAHRQGRTSSLTHHPLTRLTNSQSKEVAKMQLKPVMKSLSRLRISAGLRRSKVTLERRPTIAAGLLRQGDKIHHPPSTSANNRRASRTSTSAIGRRTSRTSTSRLD